MPNVIRDHKIITQIIDNYTSELAPNPSFSENLQQIVSKHQNKNKLTIHNLQFALIILLQTNCEIYN